MALLPLQNLISKDIATGVMAVLAIFSLSVFLPIVGFIFSLFIPLPIVFYRAKLGRRPGAAVVLIAVALMALVFGGFSIDLLFFAGLMLLGFVMGEMFEKPLSVEMTIGATSAIVLGAGLVGVLLYSIASQTGMMALVSAYVATNLELSLKLYEGLGIPQESIDAIANASERIQYVLVRIMPSIMAASTLFVAWINLIVVRPLMLRKELAFPDFGCLNHWRAPDPLIWGVIACGVIMLTPATGIRLLGINGLLVLLTVYFMQGIAILSFYFEKKGLPRFVRVVLYTMIAFQQLFLLVVIGIGLFDMWVNFRKIDTNKHKTDLPS
ncbi:conserved uncharacterized protein, DUF2232 [Desulfosarcina variabilis str. Montpellier]|uniref:YybS family protein n=1 Tax=Desulfosarcina variabilis TaxID=2300 RepID=UPI003AFB646D